MVRAAEADLCDGFQQRIEAFTGKRIPGKVTRFSDLFRYLIQVRMFDELRGIVERDYDVFSGIALESCFRDLFIEKHAYTRMGGWWDRHGENEIDLVCENEFDKTLHFYEIKRNPDRIDLTALERKAHAFFVKNPDKRELRTAYGGLSLADLGM